MKESSALEIWGMNCTIYAGHKRMVKMRKHQNIRIIYPIK
jgi:hypothetical protein